MTKKEFNKVVASVDRFFTYDDKIVSPNKCAFYNFERHISIYVERNIDKSIWFFIRTDDKKFGKFTNSFHELNMFIKRVKLIG